MARCIIHVGMPRTGTKSIQFSLKSLDDEGFYYARIRNLPNHSVSIPIIFAENGEQSPARKRLQKEGVDVVALANQCRRDLRSSIEAAAGRTLVLSGEGMLRMTPQGLQRLKIFLNRNGCDDIEIIAYARAPMGFIESAVQQRIKSGNTGLLKIAESLPSYRGSFRKFDDVFGAQKTRLIKFDPAGFPGGDVVQDFCARTGIPHASVTPVRRNDGITRLAAQLRFQFVAHAKANAMEPMGVALSGALCDRLKALDPVPFRLSPAMVQPYLDGISQDIVWMEQRLGAVLTEDADAGPMDIASEADLLAPVPGIDDRLRGLLRDDGDAADNSGLDTWALLLRIANRAKGVAGAPRAAPGRIAVPKQPALREKRNLDTVRPRRPGKFQPKPMTVAYAMAQDSKVKPIERTPLSATPAPLLNKDKNLVVLWSPKSACTTIYVWFSHISGFSGDVMNYAAWPHKHRMEQFMKSPLYAESARDGMAGARTLRIIRDPYGRAVSIYRHALQTHFATEPMSAFSNNRISAEGGYSLQTFLDLLEQMNMLRSDIHFRPQFHPYEATRTIDRIINISKSDLFTELNTFEDESGLPHTDFTDLNWLHKLEHKRKALQEPMEGGALDEVPFSRSMVKEGRFPSYSQLLTPRARQRIETIYKADFDAYADYF